MFVHIQYCCFENIYEVISFYRSISIDLKLSPETYTITCKDSLYEIFNFDAIHSYVYLL